jgi:DNA-binding response OmpR family regulator
LYDFRQRERLFVLGDRRIKTNVAKILVVEDDPSLARMIRDWLIFEHHLVETANNGREGLDKLNYYQYDLVILDWELPEITGVELAKNFRTNGGKTPILMLTGKNTLGDKEVGFDAGIDDYLTKPFHMKELSLRLRALLRRSSPVVGDKIKYRDLELETALHRVTRDGKDLQLLPKEFALLDWFLRHPNQVFSAEAILGRVWSSDANSSVDAVSTCIKRLRKKVDVEGRPSVIKTVHGVGYKLEAE